LGGSESVNCEAIGLAVMALAAMFIGFILATGGVL
jgi:hypothetical protein